MTSEVVQSLPWYTSFSVSQCCFRRVISAVPTLPAPRVPTTCISSFIND